MQQNPSLGNFSGDKHTSPQKCCGFGSEGTRAETVVMTMMPLMFMIFLIVFMSLMAIFMSLDVHAGLMNDCSIFNDPDLHPDDFDVSRVLDGLDECDIRGVHVGLGCVSCGLYDALIQRRLFW
jgi:hypothetical protein